MNYRVEYYDLSIILYLVGCYIDNTHIYHIPCLNLILFGRITEGMEA